MDRKGDFYVYAVCRVDKDNFEGINVDFKKHGYKNLKAIVPSVDILKHVKNGKVEYTKVPLLFNYGFIKMKNALRHNKAKLNEIRLKIPGIHSWVKHLEPLHRKRQMIRTDTQIDFDDFSLIATVSKKEVLQLLTYSHQRYTHTNILNLKPGDFVTLTKYPYSGMQAEIININLPNNTARIQLTPGNVSLMIIDVPLEVVLYSVYDNFDEKFGSFVEYDLTQIPDEVEELL